ncbi:M14 family metallopeptidase [Mitsuaria sp. 7]|uniref:M14 family metallopeptidase n=1 Tax=Mitsuaria sp. 7 TaxID=1658665 RepID=UPI0007DD27F3|nr:M14 family metallopeptidase [Mitsuaria sp. 7]ANH69192.1 carboxypeptidase A2 [Mitsuaria sp. 7]
MPQPRFDVFPRHDELTQWLRAYAEAAPDLVSLESIGKSHEGRDIWVVTVTNTLTGDARDKPAFWADGNIHSIELTSCTAVLFYLHHLVSGHGADPKVTHLLDTRAIYLCPRLSPDGAELALADRPRHVRSSTRGYPRAEATQDGLTIEDIDGDGRVLSMRIPDPNGSWKQHADEPRLMVPRESGEFGGEYFRILPEGSVAGFDGVSLKIKPSAQALDLNRNFPSFWRQEHAQKGAGDYPTSEPEVKAMVDFVLAHPNIGAAISYHTFSGVILRPMGMMSDQDMIPEDLWCFQHFSAHGTEHTGYPTLSVWHDFKYHPKEVVGGTQDWLYEQLGALYWTVELWSPNRQAGITGYPWIDWFREHPVEDDLKLLRWSDEHCGGRAYVDWQPFQHPQLGAVEIGGWDQINYWRNPPPELREAEVERFPAWMDRIALSLPRLELLRAEAQALALAHDVWKIRLAVVNTGWLPTSVTQLALDHKIVRGVMFEIHLPDIDTGADADIALLVGKPRIEGPQLRGHAPRKSLLALSPDPEPMADRAVVEWTIRAPHGTTIAMTAEAERAGRIRTSVTLS